MSRKSMQGLIACAHARVALCCAGNLLDNSSPAQHADTVRTWAAATDWLRMKCRMDV